MDPATHKVRVPQAILSKWGANPKFAEALQACLDTAQEKLGYSEPLQSTAASDHNPTKKRGPDGTNEGAPLKKPRVGDEPLAEVTGPFILEVPLTNLPGDLKFKVAMGNKCRPKTCPPRRTVHV